MAFVPHSEVDRAQKFLGDPLVGVTLPERSLSQDLAILMKQRDALLFEAAALSNKIKGIELAMSVLADPPAIRKGEA